MELSELIERIDSLKREIDSMRHIDQETEQRIMQKFRLEWNYNSNHIEGNTLTYGQTQLLIIFEKTTGDHDMREYEEMKAHDVAIKMIYELAQDKERPLTETFIKQLNKTILVRPFWKEAETPDGQSTRRLIEIGDYKKFPNHVRLPNGEIFSYAKPEETPALMGDFMAYYKKKEADKTVHPLALASLLHYKFVEIHPFDDGNGRIARLLMNYILIKNEYPPVIIKSKDKRNYLTALNKADTGDIDSLVVYIGEQLLWSLEISINAAKGKSIDEEDDFDKEIELLKREGAPSAKIPIMKSREVLKKVYNSSLKKLFSEIDFQFKKFDDLFLETNHNYNIQGNIESSIMKSHGKNLDYIENQIFFDYNQPEKYGYIGNVGYSQGRPSTPLQYPHINTIQIHYHWRAYKNVGVNAFDMHYTVYIQFEDYKYSVAGEDPYKVILKKLYSEEISKEEIDDVATKISREVLEKIKRSKTNKA